MASAYEFIEYDTDCSSSLLGDLFFLIRGLCPLVAFAQGFDLDAKVFWVSFEPARFLTDGLVGEMS
jgi:hypothetical protein